MKKILIFTLVLFSQLSWSFTLALNPAPKNEITCSADLFPPGEQKIPLNGLQPFLFVLYPDENQIRWQKQIEKVEITEKDQPYYSPYWISPDNLFPYQKQNVQKRTAIDRGAISFTLSRFAETTNRIAGLSLEYNIERGFYGAYILDKISEGPALKIQALVHFDEGQGILAIDCTIKD